MKLDIEPRAALDALAHHIDHQRAALLDVNDRHTEELDIAHAEANCLRQVIDERQADIDRLTTALSEANDARCALLDALAAARGELVVATVAETLDAFPDGSTVLDRHGVMWQRWIHEGATLPRWWAHAPNLNTNGTPWSEGSGRWTSEALITQRGPVRVIHVALEGGEA